MPAMFKNGARVRQVITPITGPIVRKDLIGDDIVYFILNEATGHEVPLPESAIELVPDPTTEAPAA